MKWRRYGGSAGLVIAGIVLLAPAFVMAQSSSTNYQVNEVFFGNGGELNACSTTYCSKQASGETTVGNSASANYQFQGGFNTSDTPLLEMAVNGGIHDLGILDSATTHTTSTTFTIRNYLSNGYSVLIAGDAPTYGPHTLAPMTSMAASTPGTEQFGLNLRANTTPSVGADPQQLPDASFGFGAPAAGYDTVNQFQFNDGDTIASSPKSSGTTLYTASFIGNVSNQTPAGFYTGHLSIIVVPTF